MTSRRTVGMGITERLAHVFGPAQVGDSREPRRPQTAAEADRDRSLGTQFRRVRGADGRVRLEAVDPPD